MRERLEGELENGHIDRDASIYRRRNMAQWLCYRGARTRGAVRQAPCVEWQDSLAAVVPLEGPSACPALRQAAAARHPQALTAPRPVHRQRQARLLGGGVAAFDASAKGCVEGEGEAARTPAIHTLEMDDSPHRTYGVTRWRWWRTPRPYVLTPRSDVPPPVIPEPAGTAEAITEAGAGAVALENGHVLGAEDLPPPYSPPLLTVENASGALESYEVPAHVLAFVPPDGGMRAWAVMLAAFLCNGIIFGIINTSGITYNKIATRLQEQGDPNAAFKGFRPAKDQISRGWGHPGKKAQNFVQHSTGPSYDFGRGDNDPILKSL
ncbi:hypothetical protein GWK47_035810 [Chionoecetes opilio]|uniref:Uncharacterized protein n=1 Tax=Chionoecetes opilio TaxID=41210 RepID=A0A8J4YF24_CHIOP|nr:hypothetical protein GWK47_035810 [Chionoecetes opilio]